MDINEMLSGKNRKFLLIGGAAAGGLIFMQYRKGKLAAAPSAAVTADPNATSADPYASTYSDSTGYSNYGSDTAGLFSYTDPSTGATISGGGSAPVLTGPSTNQQWSQQVQAMLINGGYNATDVQAALGHYIVGTAMTQDQWTIVQAGIALEGQPPQGVPAPNIVPTTGGTATGTGTVKDGYYVQLPIMYYYEVQGGKLYNISPKTLADLKKQGVKFQNTLRNNPIYQLPKGTPNPI